MSLAVRLEGVSEAIKRIESMGGRIRKVHSRNAVSAAGGVKRREVERNAPDDSGTLRRNVRVRIGISKRTGDWFAAVGSRRRATSRGLKIAIKQAVSFKRGGAARRITDARATRILSAGGRVRYRGPSRYIHLTEKRNTSSAGYIAAAARSKANVAAQAAIQQLQKAIKQEAR